MPQPLVNVNYAIRMPAYAQEFSYYTKTQTLDDETGLVSFVDSEEVSAVGSIQPCEKTEKHALMETIRGGQDIREAIIIFTDVRLICGTIGDPSSSGHFIKYRDLEWIVVDVEDYSPHGHVEAIAVRLNNQDG